MPFSIEEKTVTITPMKKMMTSSGLMRQKA
jgi:hypothetical protein